MQVWRAGSGELQSPAVNAVTFGGTGREIVNGAVDGSLLVTRDDGARLPLPASRGGIDTVELLADGRVVSADAQRRLRVYAPGGVVVADLEIPMRVMSLRVDGARLVAIPNYNGSAAPPVLVDLERYRVVAQLEGHVGRVFSARWVAGDQILTAGGDGTIRLWNGSTGRLRQTYRADSHALSDATLVSDSLVVAGSADGRLQFWDRATGRQLWALHAHAAPIIGVHIEGGDIVSRGIAGELSDERGRLRIYDPDRAAVIADLELPTRVRLLRPSPDGLRLVTIPSFTGKAVPPMLWDLEHYLLIAQLEGHIGQAFSARYVDEGHAILTVGADGAARLWNGETGRLLTVYRSTSRYLVDAVVASDGSMVIAGGNEGLLWFWDRATARPLWTLQAHSSDLVGIHLEGDEVVTRGFAGDVSRWTLPKPEQVIDGLPPDR